MSEKHLSAGDLLEQLRNVASSKKIIFQDETVPKSFGSYRGYYEQLAVGSDALYDGPIDYESDSKTPKETQRNILPDAPTVANFTSVLSDCFCEHFHGYKGGEFYMSARTPLWHSNYGCASGEAICGIREEEDRVVLLTRDVE